MHFFATATLLTYRLFQAIERTPIDEEVEISLVEDGHPNPTIVVAAAESTPATNLAALELQYYIHQMTGACLPIADAPWNRWQLLFSLERVRPPGNLDFMGKTSNRRSI